MGALLALSTVGVAPVFAASQAQLAYDACTHAYNTKFRQLRSPKAIVSGVTASGHYQCFWNYGGDSLNANIRNATAACKRAGYQCFLYADSDRGNRPWVQRISDMGGSDGSDRGGGGDSAAGAALLNSMIGIAGTLIQNGGGGSREDCDWSTGACAAR